MNELDIFLTTQLINKNGIFDIKNFVELNEQLLTYIYNTRFKGPFVKKQSSFLYNQDNNIIFTNETTSVFCINKKLVNLNLLVRNKAINSSNSLLVDPREIEKYFDKSRMLFGNDSTQVTSTHKDKFILDDETTISLNEYKLIKLLLENAKIYLSKENPIIYAESEHGYAYVLGKKDRRQLRF